MNRLYSKRRVDPLKRFVAAKKIIEDIVDDGSKLTIERVAFRCGCSSRTLSSVFKLFNTTVKQYSEEYRESKSNV